MWPPPIYLFLLMSVRSTMSLSKVPASKIYDVVVVGSTGFTGSLVVEYLSKNYPSGLRWAIAGRDISKLSSIQSKLNLDPSVGLLVADSTDPESLDRLASQSKVILSTAGPFALIGTPLIEACLRSQTNYCDITGEAPWIRSVIDEHHDTAVAQRLKIVNCCGFDCIPADLGTLMMVDEMKRRDLTPIEVRYICRKSKGGVSGGTIASVMNIFSTATADSLKAASNPFYLAPRDALSNPIQASDPAVIAANGDTSGFFYDKIEGKWMSPWVMQSIDTRIVNRSNALSGWRYGQNLIYREVQAASGFFGALSASVIGALIGPLLFFSVTRNLINKNLPKPGEGPTQDLLDNGFMKIGFWGIGRDSKGSEVVVKGGVTAMNGDPGYRQTAKFIAEAGVSLALDQDLLPPSYGILTPSTALGHVLIKRLERKGVDFFVEDGTKG